MTLRKQKDNPAPAHFQERDGSGGFYVFCEMDATRPMRSLIDVSIHLVHTISKPLAEVYSRCYSSLF